MATLPRRVQSLIKQKPRQQQQGVEKGMTHILQDKQWYKKVREMNTVSVQQKTLSTALLHTTQDKKNKEMQNNTLWMKMKSTKLFLRTFLKTPNMISILILMPLFNFKSLKSKMQVYDLSFIDFMSDWTYFIWCKDSLRPDHSGYFAYCKPFSLSTAAH